MWARNAEKGPDEELDIVKMVGPLCMVNKRVQEPPLKPPTPVQVQIARRRYSIEMENITIQKTEPINCMMRSFTGYVAQVNTMQAAHLAYCQMRIIEPAADHIMAGFHVADVKGSCDDRDHSGGVEIRKQIQKANKKNLIVFVSRLYGGIHLGSDRFKIIRSLVKECFQIIDFGTVTRVPWDTPPPDLAAPMVTRSTRASQRGPNIQTTAPHSASFSHPPNFHRPPPYYFATTTKKQFHERSRGKGQTSSARTRTTKRTS